VLCLFAEIELWESWADQRWLEVDDMVHAAALSGLTDQLTQAGDKIRTHVAGVCERELLARLKPPSWSGCRVAGLQGEAR
jgi:hypothetical protein